MNGLVWLTAGLLILVGIGLSQTVSERWILLSLLAGGYLLSSGLTGWSPIERLLIRLKARKRPDNQTRDK